MKWIINDFERNDEYKNIKNFLLKRHLQSFADLWPTLMGFSIYIDLYRDIW
jgi:hypothetical protein